MSAQVPSSPFVGSDQWITLFADASFCPNTKAYGWSFWIKHGSPAKTIVKSGGGQHIETSNQAEVEALRQGILEVRRLDFKGKRIVVQSDCLGAIGIIQNDLFDLKRMGALTAYSKHVKGHQGNKTKRSSVNTTCDRNAREQMLRYRHQAETSCRQSAPSPRRTPRF